jgi:hypothetical protein
MFCFFIAIATHTHTQKQKKEHTQNRGHREQKTRRALDRDEGYSGN